MFVMYFEANMHSSRQGHAHRLMLAPMDDNNLLKFPMRVDHTALNRSGPFLQEASPRAGTGQVACARHHCRRLLRPRNDSIAADQG